VELHVVWFSGNNDVDGNKNDNIYGAYTSNGEV
jgi:hypothetical protein